MLNKILTFYTKYFAVWVVVFAVAAYFYPTPFTALEQMVLRHYYVRHRRSTFSR
jgi:predicted Na+-dependent transporter